MEIIVSQGNALDEKGQVLFIPVFEGKTDKHPTLLFMDGLFNQELFKELKRSDFSGKEGTDICIPTFGKLPASHVIFIGAGEKKKFDLDALRKLAGNVHKLTKQVKASRAMIQFEDFSELTESKKEMMEAFAEGALLATYSFLHFQSKKKQKEVKRLCVFVMDKRSLPALHRGLQNAEGLVAGVCLARELVNMPPSDMHPEAMVDTAVALAKACPQIKVKVFDRDRMKRMGMLATLAVAKGSDAPPYGVHLVYTPKKKTKKRVALVGKAVTFDSGGLSLKPADGMKTMKIDMGGAASVLGVFKTLSSVEPSVEVHGIFLAVENMPSGKAYRPGDIVRAMNGKTIEILNTDAEGRVTLADALSYASKLKPDTIIDLATLTGACVSALGEEIAGFMTADEALSEKLLDASRVSGEPLWRLPLFPSYKSEIKSKVADVKNIGGRGAGAIMAALFLEHFVDAPSWAHLDVAGPVYTEKETRADLPYGATGYGVRLLARYLQAR